MTVIARVYQSDSRFPSTKRAACTMWPAVERHAILRMQRFSGRRNDAVDRHQQIESAEDDEDIAAAEGEDQLQLGTE